MVKKDEKTVVPAEEPKTSETTPDYGNDIKSLKETIETQGKTIGELQEYVAGSSIIINTIASDSDLKQRVQGALGQQQGVQGQQQNQSNSQAQGYTSSQSQNADVVGQVNDVVKANRNTIIKDFEKSYGFDQLPQEEQKIVRQKVAGYLGEFGWEIDKLPLENLRGSLDKAYMGSIGMDKLKEEGKLEGITQARTNDMGTFGSMSGSAPNAMNQTGELSSAQMEWVKKLRVDPDGAKKTYQERDQEQGREKVVKE